MPQDAVPAPRRRTERRETATRALREAIESGRFRGTALLPGERDLAAAFGVSRTTLRHALADLIEAGVLSHRQGIGTFLARADRPSRGQAPDTGGGTEGLGVSATAASTRSADRPRVFARSVERPRPEDAMQFGLEANASVVVLCRLLTRNDEPVAVDRSVAPHMLVADQWYNQEDLWTTLTLGGHAPARTLCRVRFAPLEETDARHLGVEPPHPGQLVERAGFLADSRCCVVSRTRYRADRFDEVFAVADVPGGKRQPWDKGDEPQ